MRVRAHRPPFKRYAAFRAGRVHYRFSRAALAVFAVLAVGVTLGIGIFTAMPVTAETATATLRPDSDVTTGWGSDGNACALAGGTPHWSRIDEVTLDTADYICTGLLGAGLEEEETGFANLTPAGTFLSATQAVVNIYSNAAGGCQSTCDTLTVRIFIGGAYTSTQTLTMDATAQNRTLTFTGSWSSVNDLQVEVVRNVVGGGPGAGRDDDVRIYQMYADVTYNYQPLKPNLALTGYVFENDDGTTADTNSQLAAGAGNLSGVMQGQRLSLRTQLKNTGAGALASNLALFYDRNDGIWSKVKSDTVPETTNGDCSNNNWECTTVHDSSNTLVRSPIAVSPSGQPWIAYQDETDFTLRIAQYVGSGGSGCSDSEWTCTIVDDLTNPIHGVSIAFAPSGSPWVSYTEGHSDSTCTDFSTECILKITQYVGSGGTGCTGGTNNAAWTCSVIDNSGLLMDMNTAIALDTNGNPWVAFHTIETGGTCSSTSSCSVWAARYVGSGGTGCSNTAWLCKIVTHTTTSGESNNTTIGIAVDPNNQPWITSNRGTDTVAHYVGSGGTGCTGSTDSGAWTCESIDSSTGADLISFDSSGNANVVSGGSGGLAIATYVGSGGSGCTPSTWTCKVIDNPASGSEVLASIAFSPGGQAFIAYSNSLTNTLRLAYYVGSGGTGCTGSTDSGAWTCLDVDDPANSVGSHTSIAFGYSGEPWLSHFDTTNSALNIAQLSRAGEIIMSPATAYDNNAATSESHADMSSVTDTTNRDDADCSGGGTWNNGKAAESEEASSVSLPIGSTTAQCTEIAWTLDTSQAIAGTTYRFVVASKDAWRPDKGSWRGPVGVTSYATMTMASDTQNQSRLSKDIQANFTDCSDTTWGCVPIDDDAVDDTGRGTAIAFDPGGNAWTSYYDATATALMVAKYVGSGGTGCGAADAGIWTCTVVDNTGSVGQYSSIAFDPAGNPWVSYYESATERLRYARYVGTGGNCTSTAWTCGEIDGFTSGGTGAYSSIAFDQAGSAWISYRGGANTLLKVARYVGSSGTGCEGSNAVWSCSIVDDPANSVGAYSSIAFDKNGIPWVSYEDSTASALQVARYVGAGGSGCGGTTNWTCTTVDNTGTNTGQYTSLAFDASNNPWVSYYDATNTGLRVATKSSSFGAACTDTSWNCGVVDNDISTTTDTGQYTSLAFDASGNAWISYYENFQTSCNDSPGTECSLKIARFVGGTSGNCTSTAWSCSTVSNPTSTNNFGQYTSLAFDASGSPWVSYYNVSSTDNFVAKLDLPLNKPTGQIQLLNNGRNARSGDARYRLTPGRSPLSDRLGTCSGNADATGFCGAYSNDGNYDSMTGPGQRPLFVLAERFAGNTNLPTITWVGRSNVAPSTVGTTGDIKLQAYRFGTTNAWEDIATDSTSSNCNTDNCTIMGMPSGTASEYFEADGANYRIYLRVWQYENSATETLKTDQFTAIETSSHLRHGRAFHYGDSRPFGW